MATELQNSKCYTFFLAGSIAVRNNKNHGKKAEACAGRLITITRHERDVLLSQAMLESDTVNSAISNRDFSSLNIRENIPPTIDTYKLAGQPIWYGPFITGNIRPSKLEEEFFINLFGEKTDNITETVSRA